MQERLWFDSNRNLHCSQTHDVHVIGIHKFDSNRNLHCSQTAPSKASPAVSLTLIVIYIALKRALTRVGDWSSLTLIVIYIALKLIAQQPGDAVV